MNTPSKLLLCSLALAAAAGLQASETKKKHAHEMGPRPPTALVRALDANGDHVISAQEIANASAALKTLDANGDGKLEPNEFIGRPPSPPAPGQDVTVPAPAGK